MNSEPLFVALMAAALITMAALAVFAPRGDPSNRVRAEGSQTSSSDLVLYNSAFAFDLYHAVRVKSGNLVFSPLSISTALAIMYAGARGETEREMARALHFDSCSGRPDATFDDLLAKLVLNTATLYTERRPELTIANSLWIQLGYELLEEFVETLRVNHRTAPVRLDFRQATEASRLRINEWVVQGTRGRIKNLIPQGSLSPDSRLLFVNAIYFSASWSLPFSIETTADRRFHLLDGSTADVPMMTQTSLFRYTTYRGWEVIALPYEGTSVEMVILMPPQGRFSSHETQLDHRLLAWLVGGMSETRVHLVMPRFGFEWGGSMREVLCGVGMDPAFDPEIADLSGMNGKCCGYDPLGCLYTRDVLHKTFIGVDERGTEAAAASAEMVLVGADTPLSERADVMCVDRPFVLAIRDKITGSILFLGRVLDPR